MHEEFLCEVTGYGVCAGQLVGVPLGTYRAPSLPLALWWLRERATWIAERLDPTPDAAGIPAGALVPLPRDAPDVPGQLRAWRDNAAEQSQAGLLLEYGQLFRFIARDATTEFELLAESVDTIRIHRALGAAPRTADHAPRAVRRSVPTPQRQAPAPLQRQGQRHRHTPSDSATAAGRTRSGSASTHAL